MTAKFVLIWRQRQEFLRVIGDLFFFGGKSPFTCSLLSTVLHILRRGAREVRVRMVNAEKSSCSPSPTTFCKVTSASRVYLGRVLPYTMMAVYGMYSALVRMRGAAQNFSMNIHRGRKAVRPWGFVLASDNVMVQSVPSLVRLFMQGHGH